MATTRTNREEQMRTLATLVLAARKLRVFVAIHSVTFLAWYYLGIFLWPHQARYVKDLLKRKRHLILAPAGHGKTEAISKVAVIWQIIRNRNIRILLVSASASLAVKNCMLIREEFETNKKLIRDFGAFYSPDKKVCKIWQQNIFQVVRSRRLKDATLEAIGILGTITGGRFDLIILDDVIDVKTAASKEQRAKILKELQATLIPRLEPSGSIWAIGTRKNYNDLYAWMIDNPQWTVTQERAIIREPESWEIQELEEPWYDEEGKEHWHRAVIHGEDKGEVLCEEKWSMQDLLLQRWGLGMVIFNQEYQNIIVDDETALFQMRDLEACCDESRSWIYDIIPDDVRARYDLIVVGCDPSLVTDKKTAEEANSSNMVEYAIGLTPKRRRDLLAFEVFRGVSTEEKLEKVKDFYHRVDPDLFFMEANSFGSVYIELLLKDEKLKILPHQTGFEKNDIHAGVPSLSALFENRAFSLPFATESDKRETRELMDELHSFGLNELNDRVMALWIANTGIRRWLLGQEKLRRRRQRREQRQRNQRSEAA